MYGGSFAFLMRKISGLPWYRDRLDRHPGGSEGAGTGRECARGEGELRPRKHWSKPSAGAGSIMRLVAPAQAQVVISHNPADQHPAHVPLQPR